MRPPRLAVQPARDCGFLCEKLTGELISRTKLRRHFFLSFYATSPFPRDNFEYLSSARALDRIRDQVASLCAFFHAESPTLRLHRQLWDTLCVRARMRAYMHIRMRMYILNLSSVCRCSRTRVIVGYPRVPACPRVPSFVLERSSSALLRRRLSTRDTRSSVARRRCLVFLTLKRNRV